MNGILNRLGDWVRWLRARAVVHLSMLAVFVPIALIALVIAGYGWWWRIVADGVRDNVLGFQAAQQAQGREVVWDDFAISGFPYRVEGALAAPKLTAPDRGATWEGERVVLHVQPLALHRIGLSLEGQQHLLYVKDGRWIETNARADKAEIDLSSTRKTDNVAIDVERLAGKVTVDATEVNVIVDEADASLSVSGADEQAPLPNVELVGQLRNIALQGPIDLPLGRTINHFAIDIGAKVPAGLAQEPSTAFLLAAWRDAATPVEIRRFELEWGGVYVSAAGEFKIDAQSLPEGRFTLTLGNHPRLLELAEAYGFITKEKRELAKSALDMLAFFSGDPERRVAVPLRMEKGIVYLAMVPIATLQPPAASAQLQPQPPLGVEP